MAKEAEKNPLKMAIEQLMKLLVQPSDNLLQEWTKGPFFNLDTGETQWRDKNVPWAEYLASLRALEAGPVGREGLRAMVQRLRRLAFSFYTFKYKGATAPLFDLMMNSVDPLGFQPPLTTDHVSQDQLDILWKTSAIVTPTGKKVGISHLWTMADVVLNGTNPIALTSRGLFIGTPLGALSTWLGDLASSVSQFVLRLQEDPSKQNPVDSMDVMAQAIREKTSKGDLLGNLDGVAVANHWARSPHAFTASSFLEEYYNNEVLSPDAAARLGRPSGAHRFHYFLKHTDPSLPATGLDSNPFVTVFDKLSARNVLPRMILDAADDMADVGRITFILNDILDGGRIEYLVSTEPIPTVYRRTAEENLDLLNGRRAFDWLCDEFCRFIDEGVRTGDAVWPPTR